MQICLNGEWAFQPLAKAVINARGELEEEPLAARERRKIKVPNNWYLAGWTDFYGKALYSREFDLSPEVLTPGKRVFICFQGVDYFAAVRVNGEYAGFHEGYFQRFEFDITESVQPGNNLLEVEVTSPREKPEEVWPHQKLLVKGIFNLHDCRPGSWDPETGQCGNTGGIWNDVYLEVRDEVFIKEVRVSSTLHPENKARVTVRTIFNRIPPAGCRLQVKLADRVKEVTPVDKEVITVFTMENPRLWWCWNTGDPYLYHLEAELTGEKIHAHHEVDFGIREIKFDRETGQWFLNGQRIFVKGTNIIPTQWLAEYTPERIAKDVELLKACHINAVRIHAHVNRKELYEALDRAGIMVWQDFALQWSYSNEDHFVANAVRQIKEMVHQLYNHPSIIVWCCHNEADVNVEELDRVLYRAVREEDDSRYVRAVSEYAEHTYPGWYEGDYRKYDLLPATPLLTEFGAQAMPSLEISREITGGAWPPDWEKLAYHDFQYEQTFLIAGVETGDSLEEFVVNSQEYQAKLLKYAVEKYRRHKYEKLGGMFQFMFMECWPSVTWAVVDYHRIPKRGYYALQQAYQPVLPIMEVDHRKYFQTGREYGYPSCVVNDLFEDLKDLKIRVTINADNKETVIGETRIEKVETDSVHPFRLSCRLPDNLPDGRQTLIITVFDATGKEIGKNTYEIACRKN